ncbi:MAG: sodium:solute symporter [Bacteroidetes bacterium]|nr:sodium:solute symporter [Bacteroidota bacterium]
MSSTYIISFVIGYFCLLFAISWFTGRKSDNSSFFLANRNAPWFVVAYGMIGASLSGVTFISVPGWVETSQFSYMQMVIGYMLGYLVIATVLMPLYYRLKLTTIYSYLGTRFGAASHKTGAFYFLLSRVIGASFRLYLVAMVLQAFVFDAWNVPFWATVIVTIGLIWVYTFRGGMRTIIWTDMLQTTFMLLAVVLSIGFIAADMNLGLNGLVTSVSESNFSKMFFFDDFNDKKFFFKQVFSGAFIALAMTGLDQDMMQKNLSCRNLKDAQKNMFWFSFILILVNLLFLSLGALLYLYAESHTITIPGKTDQLFPLLALKHFSPIAGAIFILGLIAAAYSSADSALTALTTSYFVDIRKKDEEGERSVWVRYRVHFVFSLILLVFVIFFQQLNNDAIIDKLFKIAQYTYGPLLGLFFFGLFTKRKIKDGMVPLICIAAPVITYLIDKNAEYLFGDYQIAYELLAVNGALTFLGLWLISSKNN